MDEKKEQALKYLRSLGYVLKGTKIDPSILYLVRKTYSDGMVVFKARRAKYRQHRVYKDPKQNFTEEIAQLQIPKLKWEKVDYPLMPVINPEEME